MYRILALILLIASIATAQTKRPAGKPAGKPVKKDTVVAAAPVIDSIDQRDLEIKAGKQFAAYTKRYNTRKGRKVQLCINLVSGDATINKCYNDSILHDPEVSKILFEKQDGDTNYVLVFVDAFSKVKDDPGCSAGKETKLIYSRWNTKTNKAIWKSKTISSCVRGIANMTKFDIKSWDGSAPLVVSYYKGGSEFLDIQFDPQNYKAGFQAAQISNEPVNED